MTAFYIANDGMTQIALASEVRSHRYDGIGIAWRCWRLTNQYLGFGAVQIDRGDVVINFGANIGEVAICLASMGARVVAFDADPNVWPALSWNAKRYGFRAVQAALWKEAGPIELYLATHNANTSLINHSEESTTVNAVRLDQLIRRRVKLIVGDAEGAEPEILEGAANLLETTDYVSVRGSAERNGEETQTACREILERSGFEIIFAEPRRFRTTIGRNTRVLPSNQK